MRKLKPFEHYRLYVERNIEDRKFIIYRGISIDMCQMNFFYWQNHMSRRDKNRVWWSIVWNKLLGRVKREIIEGKYCLIYKDFKYAKIS